MERSTRPKQSAGRTIVKVTSFVSYQGRPYQGRSYQGRSYQIRFPMDVRIREVHIRDVHNRNVHTQQLYSYPQTSENNTIVRKSIFKAENIIPLRKNHQEMFKMT